MSAPLETVAARRARLGDEGAHAFRRRLSCAVCSYEGWERWAWVAGWLAAWLDEDAQRRG